MKLLIDEILLEIIKKIDKESKTSEEWAEVESSDMFQTEQLCGGYDADEDAFCFSYYSEDDSEYWFQFTLAETKLILTGQLREFELEKV